MVDVAIQPNRATQKGTARKRTSLRNALKRKSTSAFLMTLPLILLIAVLVIGQAWILSRIATKLAFMATATALFQQLLAHAEYTAPPLPIWPDSPAAEAIENAAKYGTRRTV